MTEQLLESFREDEAQLDGAADLRIRARIAELTRSQPDDQGAWPFSSDPVPLRPGGTDTGKPRKATAAPADASRRILAVAAAVLAVALLGGALAVQLSRSTEPTNQVGNETIESMANLARQQPDHPLAEGQYLHQSWEDVSANGSGSAPQAGQTTVELWTAMDGTGRELRTSSQSTNAPAGVSIARPSFDINHDQPGALAFGPFTYQQLRELPANSDALLAVASSSLAIPDSQPNMAADLLVELLVLEATPPPVRAAALEALAKLGAEPLGPRTDRSGRTGQAFRVPREQGSVVVILDPSTTSVLEVRGGAPDDAEPSLQSAVSLRTILTQEVTSSRG